MIATASTNMMRRARQGGARGAFTLADTMVAVAILAIAVGVAVPSLTPNDHSRLRGGATMLASDLEYAQSLSLAAPDDLGLIRFDPDDSGHYWIATASAPDDPVSIPFTDKQYEVRFGADRAALLYDVSLTMQNVPDGTLMFDEFARLTGTKDAIFTLSNGAGEITVRVSASTGSVRVE